MTGIVQALLGSYGAAAAAAVTDAYFYLTSLLLPGNGTNGAQNNTFLDSSSNNFSITRNGNTTQGTFTPFSQTGWSGNFNTSTTYLTVTDTANLRFGSGNFTIEAWVYRSASGATQTIASKGASTPTGWVFQISSGDKLVFTDTSTSITGATTLNANTWYYVAVVRAGTGASQTTLYVNGTSDATGTSGTNFNQTTNMLIGADRSTTNFANGYISNLRLSNTNRTISSTPTSALTADANTIFLALGINRFQYTDSTAAYTTMAATGTPSVQAFSPFAPTAAYDVTAVGGSGYFDGSGDYLNSPSNTALQIGTGGFSLETWFYATAASGITGIFSSLVDNVQNTFSACIYLNGTTLNFQIQDFDTSVTSYTSTITTNQWYHVAWVRDASNNISAYVNGSRIGTTTNTTNLNAQQFVVGRLTTNTNAQYFTGYIAGSRLVTGSTLPYNPTQSTITIPTAPPTSVTGTQLLLNYTNAGITDATAKNDLETVGNAQISTTQSKFGGSSMSFSASNSYLKFQNGPNQNFALGSGDWTIEGWVYTNSLSATQTLFDIYDGNSSGRIIIQINTSGQIQFLGSGGANRTTSTSPSISATTWTHFAICKASGSTRIFIGGTQANTTYADTNTYTCTTGVVYFGINGFDASSNPLNAYIDDLRITKYARYTANFTPPTSAFPLQ